MTKVTHLRAFTVNYLAPTNTRESKIKIADKRNEQKVVIPYDYKIDDTLNIAIAYLEKNNFNVISWGDLGSHYVILCDNWDNEFISLKKTNK